MEHSLKSRIITRNIKIIDLRSKEKYKYLKCPLHVAVFVLLCIGVELWSTGCKNYKTFGKWCTAGLVVSESYICFWFWPLSFIFPCEKPLSHVLATREPVCHGFTTAMDWNISETVCQNPIFLLYGYVFCHNHETREHIVVYLDQDEYQFPVGRLFRMKESNIYNYAGTTEWIRVIPDNLEHVILL